MAEILLVRHGESAWNAAGRWQGWADVPLTDLGRRQADVAAGSVGVVDAVISSDLGRARETAERIAAALGAAHEVAVEAGLRERDAGQLTGLTRAEIAERFPDLELGVPDFHPPGGETSDQLLGRVEAALRSVARRWPAGRVLAVSHAGVVRSLERHREPWPGRLPNLGGVVVQVDGDDIAVGDRVLLVDPDAVAVTTSGLLE